MGFQVIKSIQSVTKIVMLLFTFSAVLFVSQCRLFTRVDPKLKQQEVERVLDEIAPPVSSARTDRHVIFKSDHGNVADDYKSELSYNDIRSYYDHQLSPKGWVFQKESKLLSWSTDKGEMMAFYCKGTLSTELYYTGTEESRLGYRYSISVSWGIYPCK
jgi:hypothetical protein